MFSGPYLRPFIISFFLLEIFFSFQFHNYKPFWFSSCLSSHSISVSFGNFSHSVCLLNVDIQSVFIGLGSLCVFSVIPDHFLCVLVTQFCLTLCDPMDCSPPGSSIHGILQARILEWVAISFSRGSSQPRDWTQVSSIAGRFFTIWATREAQSLLMCMLSWSLQPYGLQPAKLLCPWDFPGKKYWSGLPFPPPGDLPDPGVKPTSPVSPVFTDWFFTAVPPRKSLITSYLCLTSLLLIILSILMTSNTI